jgi:nucleoside-diphosphate-sugar epimerase
LNELLATLNKDASATNLEPDLQGTRDRATCAIRKADISKAGRMLDYKPIVGLEKGLRETVKWFTAA